MRDYIDLGSTPYGEECAQLGSENYHAKARSECYRYIEQLRRTFGPEPKGASLKVKSNSHDFGVYLTVVVDFDDNNEAATAYAYRLDNEPPARWEASSPDQIQADRVCDYCISAAQEEGIPDQATQALVMLEMGADMPDHLCAMVEEPDIGYTCLCACVRYRRHAMNQAYLSSSGQEGLPE